jgi:hypothetical protein
MHKDTMLSELPLPDDSTISTELFLLVAANEK